MLVNVITRYPVPPPAVLEPALVENDNAFGAHSITVATHYLLPIAVQNEQVFGNNSAGFAPTILEQTRVENANAFGASTIQNLAPGVRHLFSAKVVNASQFGGAQVRVSHRYLVQARVANANQFGVPRVHFPAQLLTQSKVTNANQFGAQAVAAAEKSFSYSNPLGAGDRTGTITVTTSGGSTFDSPSKLVNGNTTENAFWGFGAITIKFDLGSAKVVRQARWRQDTSTTHTGLFQWQGSNDDASYADIGGTFNLGGAPISLCNTLINNTTAYRYYRLVPTSGASLSGTPYFREVEFYIEGSTKDQPDPAYTFPCGGGVNAGGQSAGTGGNGVSRTSLITVTGSFTPPDGVLANLVNGLAANNASESTDFANGLTNAIITFDFQPSGRKHVVVGIQWEQNNSTGQGNYDWEASNDNTNWTTLKSNFSLVNGSSFNETTWASITAYRYHRLKQVGGSTSSSPWIHEIYFKCAPGAYAADAI
jgi:hypothetical protein